MKWPLILNPLINREADLQHEDTAFGDFMRQLNTLVLKGYLVLLPALDITKIFSVFTLYDLTSVKLASSLTCQVHATC